MKHLTAVILGLILILLLAGCQPGAPTAPVDQTPAATSGSVRSLERPAWPACSITNFYNGSMTIVWKRYGGAASYKVSYDIYDGAVVVGQSGSLPSSRGDSDLTCFDANIQSGFSFIATVKAYSGKGVLLATSTSDKIPWGQ